MRKTSLRTIAAVPRDGGIRMTSIGAAGSALLLGGEGPGLSDECRRSNADARVTFRWPRRSNR